MDDEDVLAAALAEHGAGLLSVHDGWVAVCKPSGLLSVPGRDLSLPSVLGLVRRVAPGAEAPHRLDMDTSGVLVVATDRAAMVALSAAFQARAVRKVYAAVVAGAVARDEGIIDLPIGALFEERPRRRVDLDGGKPARTAYSVVSRGPRSTRVRLEPQTGRTHQLRVHLAALGHPILGDALYGDPASAARLMLHATDLSFLDPTTGVSTSLRVPAPF